MKLGNFNLFDSMTAAIYDPMNSNGLTSTNNVKSTPIHHSMVNGTHHSQTIYSNNSDYNPSNGYWNYHQNQTFLSGSTRQYIGSTDNSLSTRPELNYSHHSHSSYPTMPKMPTNYSSPYEFYPNSKYCWHKIFSFSFSFSSSFAFRFAFECR